MPPAHQSHVVDTPARRLDSPRFDIAHLIDVMSSSSGPFIAWAAQAGLLRVIAERNGASCDDLVAGTPLSRRGVEAFLGVLGAMNVVSRGPGGTYMLSELVEEFLDDSGPYYIGPSIETDRPIPPSLLKSGRIDRLSERGTDVRIVGSQQSAPPALGTAARLSQQHHRNFAPAVVAVRSGAFAGIGHLADIGGGSGVFAIPLALDYPEMKCTLIDLPHSLTHVRNFLDVYGVGERIDLVGWNMFTTPWPVEDCDGVLFSNIMHACDDEECRLLLHEASQRLPRGGRVLIHEVLWNERKDGPVYAATLNFRMMVSTGGRKRSAGEIERLLTEAGFTGARVTPTAGYVSLITAAR